MITETNIFQIFEKGLPPIGRGIYLDFLPSDLLLRQLTRRFMVEFAIIYIENSGSYNMFRGELNSIELPNSNVDYLIKHTHPRGTIYPSIFDILWLKGAQNNGSNQVKSMILPNAKERKSFNINSDYINLNGEIQTNT